MCVFISQNFLQKKKTELHLDLTDSDVQSSQNSTAAADAI